MYPVVERPKPTPPMRQSIIEMTAGVGPFTRKELFAPINYVAAGT